jgi:hypothetical protein
MPVLLWFIYPYVLWSACLGPIDDAPDSFV